MLSGFGRQARPLPYPDRKRCRDKEGVTFFIDLCQYKKKPLLAACCSPEGEVGADITHKKIGADNDVYCSSNPALNKLAIQ